MNFYEAAAYFLAFMACCVAGLYYTLTGINPDACILGTFAAIAIGIWVALRLVWLDGAHARAHRRRMKQIDKDIERARQRH
jgi:hypothetical protein